MSKRSAPAPSVSQEWRRRCGRERSVLGERVEVEMASIALVVAEPGSDWPAFVRGAAHNVVALSHTGGDIDSGTLQWVWDRAARSSAVVRLAVLACSEYVDDDRSTDAPVRPASFSLRRHVRTAGHSSLALTRALASRSVSGSSNWRRRYATRKAKVCQRCQCAPEMGSSGPRRPPMGARTESDLPPVSHSLTACPLDVAGFDAADRASFRRVPPATPLHTRLNQERS